MRDRVTFTTQVTTPAAGPCSSQSLPDPTEGEKLDNLSTEELKALVVTLRKHLAFQKELLNAYSNTIDKLLEKR